MISLNHGRSYSDCGAEHGHGIVVSAHKMYDLKCKIEVVILSIFQRNTPLQVMLFMRTWTFNFLMFTSPLFLDYRSCKSTIANSFSAFLLMILINYVVYVFESVVLAKRLQSETRTTKTRTGQSFKNKRTTQDQDWAVFQKQEDYPRLLRLRTPLLLSSNCI